MLILRYKTFLQIVYQKLNSEILIYSIASIIAVIEVISLILAFNPSVTEEYKDFFINETSIFFNKKKRAASLDEGLDMGSLATLPDFIEKIAGFRQNDGYAAEFIGVRYRTAKISYTKPFQNSACIAMQLDTIPDYIGKKIIVRFGQEEKEFIMEESKPVWYAFQFKLKQPETSIEIDPLIKYPPFEWDLKDTDRKRFKLFKLYALPGECNDIKIIQDLNIEVFR